MNQNTVRAHLSQALSHIDQRERENIITYYLDARQKEILTSSLTTQELEKDAQDLKEGVPVQYVTGVTFFYGHRFISERGCLIPRPETEELVHWIIEDNKSKEEFQILDIGVGSGCILLSVLAELNKNSQATGWGIDVSQTALTVFEKNAVKMDLKVNSELTDIREDLDLPKYFDCIVSNPPYILNSERGRMDSSVLKYEPEIALFVTGTDPLYFYKRIMEIGLSLLKPAGVIYFETSDLYHDELDAAIDRNNYLPTFKKDMSGHWRKLKLTRILPS